MSGIYYDPSEARMGTRLHPSVIEAGQPIRQLEAATGADLLVSASPFPLRDLDGSDTTTNLLRKHIQKGVLIARKTGRDAVSSIPAYPAILQRMCQWTPYPFLILIGDYKCNKEGCVIVDGQETQWNYLSFVGALDYWQLRGVENAEHHSGVSGGYVNWLSRDTLLLPYLNNWLERLQSDSWNENPEYKIIERVPKQILGDPDWTSILASLNVGIGADKAATVEKYFRDLADALTFLSDYESLKGAKIKGLSKSHVRKVKRLLGLGEDEVLRRGWAGGEEEPELTVPDFTIHRMLTTLGTEAQCKGCEATIYWLRTKHNKAIPYNVFGQPHFSDCPLADEFRKDAA